MALWIVATNLWANPSYNAAAPYLAAFLLCGFFLGRRAGIEAAPVLFKAALAFALVIAGWAIWQRVAQGETRAHALFETPATLGATINLILLPALVVLVWGARRLALAVVAGLLIAALVVTASRGAWLAAAGGGVIAVLLARRSGFRVVGAPLAVLGVAAVLVLLLHRIAHLDIGSSLSRLDLYGVTLKGIATASPIVGSGYLSFYYLLETEKAAVAGYANTVTYFVHNDYLQFLLELGIPGLACLLVLVALPQIQAWRTAVAPAQEHRLAAVALSAALASMAMHALVDFPFYIPVCVLMYAAAAGLLDSLQAARTPVRMPRVVAVAGVTLGLWVLVTPLAAQAAAYHAARQWSSGHGESAAYWFEVARRIEPRDWRYHWYSGQFWRAHAQTNKHPEAARLADAAFAAGYAANPREVRNLLGRISTHLLLRDLLAAPADPATLLKWADTALALAPQDRAVRAERNLVLQVQPK